MNARECGGLVETLRGENVLFTGTVTVDGEHLVRTRCRRLVLDRGGRAALGPSRDVTVLVHGDLQSANVIDPRRGYSQKLVFFEMVMAEEGVHIHVIGSRGFEALLHGRPAPCHRLRKQHGRTSWSTGPGPAPALTERSFSDVELESRLTRGARRAAYRMIRRHHGLTDSA